MGLIVLSIVKGGWTGGHWTSADKMAEQWRIESMNELQILFIFWGHNHHMKKKMIWREWNGK